MRFLIPLILILALDLYVFQAFKIISQNWTEGTRAIMFGLYWLIPAIAALTFLMASISDYQTWDKNFFSMLRAILIIAYVSKLLIGGVLLIDDIRRLLMSAYEGIAGHQGFDYSRSKFLSTFGVLLGAIPFVTLTYGMIRNRHRYKIFNEKVAIENLPKNLEGLRIVQISDIHSGSFTLKEPIKNAIEMINGQKADLVFFTGDLVNSIADEMDYFMDVFDKIESKYGTFSILGNHDYGDYVQWPNREAKIQNLEKLKGAHGKLGWDLLLNENRMVKINEEEIAIIGVENYSASRHFPKYGDLEKAYSGAENASLKLLLSHDPTHWEAQVVDSFKDIAITFSGHTHGMQFGIEIPGFLKWSPIKYIYKHWAGLYQTGKQYLYVNRGFGFLGYPGRVGILPEITVLELVRGNS